jgi:hypothetical protein
VLRVRNISALYESCAPSGFVSRNLCPGKSLRKMPATQRNVTFVAADLDLLALAFGPSHPP